MTKFTGWWGDCFHSKNASEQVRNIKEFASWVKTNPHVDFYWPNYAAAPWHIQCITKIGDGKVEMNFWPHKSKAQFKYEKAIEPLSAFVDELVKRQVEAEKEEDFDVVE